MTQIKTSIIPYKSHFTGKGLTLDLQAICVFTAIGFFLDEDTYYKEQKALSPGRIYDLTNNEIKHSEPYFNWYYSPVERSFNQVLYEFSELFESIISEQVKGQKVILPLSGGLDSRSLAAALNRINSDVFAFSYEFEGGYPETKIAKQIASACGFDFKAFQIPKGYLWDCIEELAAINKCYSEFTHPRQMAVLPQLKQLEGVFSLGHWGDVLFDDMGVSNNLSFAEILEYILGKILKKGGLELSTKLWEVWGLDGTFEEYLRSRVSSLLHSIDIPNNANARIRAFKSLYWAPRWTSVNLSAFESAHPIRLPYFDPLMCQFICEVPERFLSGRQIQIAYIKKFGTDLAKIEWQEQKPYNLFNYHKNKMPQNLIYRIPNKLKRISKNKIGKPYIQRNWELQFLGPENDKHLRGYLFSKDLADLVPKEVTSFFYDQFKDKNHQIAYSHPISMLLTLALFQKNQN